MLEQLIFPAITSIIGALVGWFFGRPKEHMELQTSELDNVDKAVKIYREMIDDLGVKHAKAIAELKGVYSELKEANKRIVDLEKSVDELVQELKKYKQLNGKK